MLMGDGQGVVKLIALLSPPRVAVVAEICFARAGIRVVPRDHAHTSRANGHSTFHPHDNTGPGGALGRLTNRHTHKEPQSVVECPCRERRY